METLHTLLMLAVAIIAIAFPVVLLAFTLGLMIGGGL